jgi:hypothetical protein
LLLGFEVDQIAVLGQFTNQRIDMAQQELGMALQMTAQEAYFSEKTAYTDVAACAATGLGYSCSSGVQVEAEANLGKGWQATATHTGTDQTCIIKTGSYVGSTEADGEPVCA